MTPDLTTAPDLAAVERDYRLGQLSNREIARQHGRSEGWVRKLAKAKSWTRDLSAAVRHRVRESLVREGVRANGCEPGAGAQLSDAAVIDEAAAIGVELVRSHRRDIQNLREAAAGLLEEFGTCTEDPVVAGDEQRPYIKITDRSRVIADLSAAMARLVPLERQAFGLDEPGQGEEKTYEERLRALCASA